MHRDAWSNDRDQQLEVSPETSFLQRIDQCQRTDAESPKAQVNQRQQTKALSTTMTDMPDCAKYTLAVVTGSLSPQPVDAQKQQPVKARTLGSSVAQPQPTAVGTSTAAQAESPEADSSDFAAVFKENCQGRTTAGQLLLQDEVGQLAASPADSSQLMQARPFAEWVNQLCGDDTLPGLLSAPPASAMPAASKTVTVTAFGAMHSPAEHFRALHTPSTAAAASAVRVASLPAVSVLNVSPHRCASQQLGISMDNAQQPALQPLHVDVAQSNDGRSQALPVSLAEPIAVQQQHMCSAHAEIEQRDASTEVVDVGVETEHRWLLSTAWAEQRQWLAARRHLSEGDARWELDESDSISGDSEGSVSSESTLRPSSVGALPGQLWQACQGRLKLGFMH